MLIVNNPKAISIRISTTPQKVTNESLKIANEMDIATALIRQKTGNGVIFSLFAKQYIPQTIVNIVIAIENPRLYPLYITESTKKIDTNKITIIVSDGTVEEYQLKSKRQVAVDIIDKMEKCSNMKPGGC